MQSGLKKKVYFPVLTNDQLRGAFLLGVDLCSQFLIFVLVLLKIPTALIRNVKLEHGRGVKEFLFMNGISGKAYWASHFLADAIVVFLCLFFVFKFLLAGGIADCLPFLQLLRQSCFFD
ncbi:unnamed protein product, partial [Amoebophrya sp. A120]|eukprot:GSA120T00011685001.1